MKNIIITGGELFNKGAQAMTFVAVNELRRLFPEHEIFLLSEMDYARPEHEKMGYNFRFMGWYPIKFARSQHNLPLRILCKIKNRREYMKADSIYTNCEAMIDVSGYALGSNWSSRNCDRYLDHLEFAQAFHIPVYLMPQSFGPFVFSSEQKALDERIRRLLPTAKMIFAREQEGYDALVNTYGLTNVQLAQDLVLNSKEINLARVFERIPDLIIPDILPDSVAVIPNTMNTNVSDAESIQQLYADIINILISHCKNAYILSHSGMDAAFCHSLKELFDKDKRVILLDQDFSCLEFNELVKHFDYCIASRFHSIVHSYKNGIPCIAVGWATKYHDLLKQFNQEQYMFDVRKQIASAELADAISQIEQCYHEESEIILEKLAAVQEQNVFDILAAIREQ